MTWQAEAINDLRRELSDLRVDPTKVQRED